MSEPTGGMLAKQAVWLGDWIRHPAIVDRQEWTLSARLPLVDGDAKGYPGMGAGTTTSARDEAGDRATNQGRLIVTANPMLRPLAGPSLAPPRGRDAGPAR
jgi:hypothetical protein